GQEFDVGSGSYATGDLQDLIDEINEAANPAELPGGDIAVASGSEITITGPPGGVEFSGSAVSFLGLPEAVAAGQTATTTNAAVALATTVNTVVEWIMEEVGPDPLVPSTNALDGAWVTWDTQRQPAPVEDRRQIFVYQHGLYNGLHIGVNGIGNLQEACFVG